MTDRNKKSEKRSFTGDIDAQASIKVTRNDRSVALTLTKTLMKKIGFRGNRCSPPQSNSSRGIRSF